MAVEARRLHLEAIELARRKRLYQGPSTPVFHAKDSSHKSDIAPEHERHKPHWDRVLYAHGNRHRGN